MNVPARRDERQPVPVDDLMKPIISLDQAMRVSDVLARSELVPVSLANKPANVFHVIMTGQQLGLHWTEAVRVIFSPGRGQIGLRAQFLLHQVRKAGHRYVITPDENQCTVKITRGDTEEVFESTFTIEDAVHGGLVSRKPDGSLVALSREGKPLPWMQWDKRLLRWRAVTDVVSFAVPEAGLGFQIDDGTPEPAQPVELRPETPALPVSAGQAATGGQAGQVKQRLQDLDEQVAQRRDALRDALTEQERLAMASEAVEASDRIREQEIARPEGGDSGEIARPGPDPHMGGIPADEPAEDAAPPQDVETPPADVDEAVGEPTEAELRRDRAVLAGLFTDCGYDPRRYRSNVLHACSSFARRQIKGVRDLEPGELYALTDALREILARTDELAPVTRLADEVDKWVEEWRAEDPAGLGAYEEAVQHG